MRGMQFKFEEKGLFGFEGIVGLKKEGKNEPISVLDKRSPSPSTSTSTLSSSAAAGGGFGGSGSTDNITSVMPGSMLQEQEKEKEPGLSVVTDGGGGGPKEEWGTELLSDGLAVAGGERYGLGLEDWETLLTESTQDQSLLRWISGDAEEATPFSLKKLLQGTNASESSNLSAPDMADHSFFNFKPIPALSSIDDATMVNTNPNLSFNGGFGFCSNDDNDGKVGSISPNSPNFGFDTNPIFSNSQNSNFSYQLETQDGKAPIFNPLVFMNQQVPHNQNPFEPQPKRQNLGISEANLQSQIPKVPFFDMQKPLMVPKKEAAVAMGGSCEQMAAAASHHYHQQQKQVTYDQLYKAAELIIAGNFSHAQMILARLNHQLSPTGKPFHRAAFYFKEALQVALLMPNSAKTPTPFDAMFKMGAYKAFSEVSPLIHFANFTSNQAILEAIDDAERIHIIDFDIGFGAQWASFMQELPRRNRCSNGMMNPSVKITAFASPSTHHPFELGLMYENLTQFANEIGVSFELEVVNFDTFDPSSYTMSIPLSSVNEAVAVNLPIWACSNHLSALPSLLQFIKQLSPKIVVSLDRGFEWTDLPISQHILHSLQYYEVLFDSIDASNVTSDISNRIEKFLCCPKIESIVLGRLGLTAPGKMPSWKSLFASAGFSPMPFSNFSKTQGEYVAKRAPTGHGFHVEKRQASLVLSWRHRELVSALAWRC